MSRNRNHKRHVPVGRTQHLIDIENLSRGAFPTRAEALAILDDYLAAADWRPGDLAVLAANTWLHKQIAWDLPTHVRALPVTGPDAADRALLDATSPEHISLRFDRLVVGSGDGIFTDLVATTAGLGVPAWVVSAEGCLSRRLSVAATRTVALQPPAARAA